MDNHGLDADGLYTVDQAPPPYAPPPYQGSGYAASGYPVSDALTPWSSDPPSYTLEYKQPDDSNVAYNPAGIPDYTAGPDIDFVPRQLQEQQLQQHNTVIIQQPDLSSWGVHTGPALADPPEDYMCYSIFVTLCCCWLVGVFAIARSAECRAAIAIGDRVTAEAKSREARSRAHWALGLGIASSLLIVLIYFFVWMARAGIH